MSLLANSRGDRESEPPSGQIELPLRVAVCAWCKPRYWGAGPGSITHGICPRHLRKLKQDLGKMPPKMDRNTFLLRLRWSRKLQKSVEKVAGLQNIDVAEVVQRACEDYVNRAREAKPMLPLFANF